MNFWAGLSLRCARPALMPIICFSKFPRAEALRLAIYVKLPEGTQDVGPPRASFGEGAYIERRSIRRDGGLAGQAVSIEGLSATSTDVLVRIESLAGAVQTERLSPTKTTFIVQATPGAGEVAATYLRLGGRTHPFRLRSPAVCAGAGDPRSRLGPRRPHSDGIHHRAQHYPCRGDARFRERAGSAC